MQTWGCTECLPSSPEGCACYSSWHPLRLEAQGGGEVSSEVEGWLIVEAWLDNAEGNPDNGLLSLAEGKFETDLTSLDVTGGRLDNDLPSLSEGKPVFDVFDTDLTSLDVTDLTLLDVVTHRDTEGKIVDCLLCGQHIWLVHTSV